MDWFQISVEATPPTNYHKVIVDSMAEPLSKHARLSAHDVIGMLEDVEMSSDEYDSDEDEYDSDEDECAGEVICDGSDSFKTSTQLRLIWTTTTSTQQRLMMRMCTLQATYRMSKYKLSCFQYSTNCLSLVLFSYDISAPNPRLQATPSPVTPTSSGTTCANR